MPLFQNICRFAFDNAGQLFSANRVADRGRERLYVQVAYLMPTAETREREFRVLEDIPDNHPKLVLSLDPVPVEHPGGIRHVHVVDFLMQA